jgi:hypothetical protein
VGAVANRSVESFEWDEAKRESNLDKHGIDFLDAIHVFRDPLLRVEIDWREDFGEDRYRATGAAYGRLLVVIYTEHGEAVRIVSARKATRHERRRHEEDSG